MRSRLDWSVKPHYTLAAGTTPQTTDFSVILTGYRGAGGSAEESAALEDCDDVGGDGVDMRGRSVDEAEILLERGLGNNSAGHT